MTTFPNRNEPLSDANLSETATSRRNLLRVLGGGAAATAATLLIAGCGGSSSSSGSSTSSLDSTIITAAATAEALASTMYYNIITGPLYTTLASNAADQAYIVAAFQEEVIHYNTLVASGGKSLASAFYFPTGMFTDAQTTINTLITLEDAFIAAYLIGVRDFSSSALKVLAAQIMGIECEHRALGRVVGLDLGLTEVTGLAGAPGESVTPPSGTSNNLAFERTFSAALPNIAAVEKALGPFIGPGATGFSTTGLPLQTALPSGVTAVTLSGTTPTG